MTYHMKPPPLIPSPGPPPNWDPFSPDLYKFSLLGDPHKVVGKRVVGLRLKGLLVFFL